MRKFNRPAMTTVILILSLLSLSIRTALFKQRRMKHLYNLSRTIIYFSIKHLKLSNWLIL
jgi:hypothetical protein